MISDVAEPVPNGLHKETSIQSCFFEMILFILNRFQTLTVCSPALSSGADGKYSFLASVIQHNILNTRI